MVLAAAAAGCARAHPPNILLIVADTARADRCSTNGYGRPTTPALESLGREGAVFLAARSPSPWTLPAHASLFTGLYPSAHGADSGSLRLDPSLPLLARLLKESGYGTRAFVANPWVGKDYNFHEGFDAFDEVWREVRGTEGDMGAEAVNGKIARWLDWRAGVAEAREAPFFIFVNYFEPHLPYNPPEPERGRFIRPGADREAVERLRRFKHPDEVRQIVAAAGGAAPAAGRLAADDLALLSELYDGEIAYVDRRIGELVGILRERGLLDATVVVVTSDHGEMLGEHGLMDHKLNLYEPVLRIPLVLRYPPAVAPGQRIDTPVMLQDLHPTLLALAGAPRAAAVAGEARPLPGVAGLDAGPPRGRSDDDPLIAEYARPVEFLPVLQRLAGGFDTGRWDRALVAWQAGDRKLIWASDGSHEIYDLGADPAEVADRCGGACGTEGAGPDGASRGIALVDDWLARPAARPPLARRPGIPAGPRLH